MPRAAALPPCCTAPPSREEALDLLAEASIEAIECAYFGMPGVANAHDLLAADFMHIVQLGARPALAAPSLPAA